MIKRRSNNEHMLYRLPPIWTIQSITLVSIVALLFSCQRPSETHTDAWDSTTFYFDWNALASQLVQRMRLEPGEKVLLVARPGKFDPLIPLLKDWIEEANGEFLGTISVDSTNSPEAWKTPFTSIAEGSSFDALVERFKAVDIAIMLPGTSVTDRPYAAMQDVLRGGHGRTIHFHWAGAYALSGSLLEVTTTVDSIYQNAIFATDYRRLAELQNYFEEFSRRHGIRVTTPQGTDITFALKDRPVTKQNGDASRDRTRYARNLIDREIEIPAGAIRVAPIEETVEGKIAFPKTEWSGETVTGLVLTFKAGKIIGMKAETGLQAVQAELKAAGPAGYAFREFALGFNPLLAIPTDSPKWIPYYGYGAGVVRLSLGDNTELGGKVGGGYVRWNFFTDATVKLGNTVIVEDGKMLQ